MGCDGPRSDVCYPRSLRSERFFSSLLVAATLQDEGYEVSIACDGLEVVEKALASRPDVLVLDLQMPGMGGREAYRELRSRGIDVPALILSANGAYEARAELDAAAAIEKPFDPADLLRRIARMLAAIRPPSTGDPPIPAPGE